MHATLPPSYTNAELAFLFPDGDDRGWSKLKNGFQHSAAPAVPLASLPAPTRARLIHQLALTVNVVKRYPTVRDAEAAGYRCAGPFKPGLGTHYLGGVASRSDTLTDAEILHPSAVIYDGTAPSSPVAGVMYMYEPPEGGQSRREPEGFAGPNDQWHYHTGIYLVPGPNGVQEASKPRARRREARLRGGGG
ncbi:MAG TPA: hypothetical protein VHG28_03070, partial [Longimicrobiaceae bacterium]|nr:hypothetical protein [Longimicrobiaceae bacterium]